MKTYTDEVAFKMGFAGAAKRYAWGAVIEDLLKEISFHHTADYQAGAQAWADLYLGWTSTPFARAAEKLGLST